MLFDIDGTLIDSHGAGRAALHRAFGETFGVREEDLQRARVPFAGMTDRVIFRSLAERLGIAGHDYDRAESGLFETYVECLREEMARDEPRRRILPGVVPLLDDLSGRDDVALGLLTGNVERGARIKLEPFDLNRYFPTGGFASDHADRAAIARTAVERVGNGAAVDPRDVVVIGDTEHDVACAVTNRYRAVAVLTGFGDVGRIREQGPDVVLEDLSDLGLALQAVGLGRKENAGA